MFIDHIYKKERKSSTNFLCKMQKYSKAPSNNENILILKFLSTVNVLYLVCLIFGRNIPDLVQDVCRLTG